MPGDALERVDLGAAVSNAITQLFFQVTPLGEVLPGPFTPDKPNSIRGFGVETYGDPFGAGGPLSVVFAIAISGQTVRVVFNEEPAHYSPAGANDALNPSNYFFSIVSGDGKVPIPLGVSTVPALFPDSGVRTADQYGFDVSVDQPLALGMRYRVEARRIVSRAGLGLGFTYGTDFMGVVPPATARPKPRRTDFADLATTPDGAFRFDGGDIATAPGSESYRTRVLRRASTVVGSFVFLQGYGAGFKLKNPASPAEISVMQKDLKRQLEREPETETATITTKLIPLPGILTVNIYCKTKQGAFETSMQVQADGLIVFK